MATIIERDVHHSSGSDASAAMNTIIAVLAVVLIVGFALYALQVFPFAANNTGTNIDVDLPNVTTPVPTDNTAQ